MIWDTDKGLFLQRFDQLGERDWRSDRCYKLIFSPFGKGTYQTKYGDLSIDQHEFVIFNPLDEHKQLGATKEKFLVEMDPLLLSEAAEGMNLKCLPIEFASLSYKHTQITQWSHFMREFLSHQQGKAADLFIDHSLVQLSILILEYGLGSHHVELPVEKGDEPVHRVIAALRESYIEDWSLSDMAAIARMNKYHLSHAFNKQTGLSPYSWLQLYRLFKSQKELVETDHSVVSIAFDHGFSSINSYNHLFKKIYRKTPTEFRRFYKVNTR